MSVETGLRDYLADDATVAGIVGANIYPQEAPDAVNEPFIVYRLIESDEPRFLNGAVRYRKYTYEIACYEKVYDDAQALADAVKAAVGGSGGTNSVATTLDGTSVVMYWADAAQRKDGVSTPDQLRNQVVFDLVILIRG